jgi:hypothetical protein
MGDAGEAAIPRDHVRELADFFAAHDRWLFGHACVRTQGDRELAADLVQDTFEAAAIAWAALREHAGERQRAAARHAGAQGLTAGGARRLDDHEHEVDHEREEAGP